MNIKKVLVSTLGTAAVLGAGLFASTTSANADVRVSVKSGDTVAKIANQYNSSISAIESANSMKNVNLIYVGESLVVPSSASSTASTTTTATQSTTPSQSTQTTSNYSSNNTSANYNAQSTGTTSSAATSSNSSSAKAWIANKESGGSYSARNGQYVGKYQLSASYLHGDYSAANQEKVANSYVSSRYGSWSAAKSFWQANGWY
ncbi:aggregation promoting factor-like surface protein [Levilactobacillus senmaizukei DSM 21775 = NBRC 103853]|uniref:Aggregation promoting factor-like surface protein n=1 Tax=Levilactobacillus senmaizukei DSM 21775 = NBRC 103853 TaxID=1423803 RepID=A0A0R2DEW7_9LACO|nr:LysM peptidoglycan-binding domain-containing protein [Levilactobacillus senmaizukei]KRN01827.1 aggregation promoting factor-like surface protein [Levilactobacillus senmaizukei DSM 21775 = NBRC 103853]